MQLQVVLHDGTCSTFHFVNSAGPEAQAKDRDQVKMLLQNLLPKFKRQIDGELEMKSRSALKYCMTFRIVFVEYYFVFCIPMFYEIQNNIMFQIVYIMLQNLTPREISTNLVFEALEMNDTMLLFFVKQLYLEIYVTTFHIYM